MSMIQSFGSNNDSRYIRNSGIAVTDKGKAVSFAGVNERLLLNSVVGPGNFETGPELITNGTFELYSGTPDDGIKDTITGWTSNSTLTGVDEITLLSVKSGSAALKLTRGTGNGSIKQIVSVTPGDRLCLWFWSAGNGTVGGRYFIKDETNSANIIATTDTGAISTTYTHCKIVFTVPVGCNSVGIYLFASLTNGASALFDNVSLRKLYDMSFLFWFKRVGAIDGERLYAFCRYNEGTNRMWAFLFDDYVGHLRFAVSTNGDTSSTPGATSVTIPQAGRWYLGAATYQVGSNSSDFLYKIYLDGILEGEYTGVGPMFNGTAPLSVGATTVTNNEHWFSGEIGEIQIIRGKLLTSDEILSVFQYGIPFSWANGTVIAHYDWRGSSDAHLTKDISGNGNNLTGSNVSVANQVSGASPYKAAVLEWTTDSRLVSRSPIIEAR